MLSAEQDVSLLTTLLAAFEILLHHECLQRDLLVGTSLAGRPHRELQPLVGCFSNFVAIRSRIDDDPTCAELLKRTGQQVSAARDNQPFPLSRLIEQLQVRPDASRPPLVQVAFLLERHAGQDQHGIAACLLGHGGHRFHWGELAVEAVDCPAPQRRLMRSRWRWKRPAAGFMVAGATTRTCLRGTPSSDCMRASPLRSNKSRAIRCNECRGSRSRNDRGRGTRRSVPRSWIGAAPTRSVAAQSIDYDQEAQLDADIVPPEGSVCDPRKMDRLFLTGATGFLGAFLLDELLRTTCAKIYCLVRAPDEVQALQRTPH